MSLNPNLLISSPIKELEAGLWLDELEFVASDLVGDFSDRSSASAISSSSSPASPMLSSSSSSSTEPDDMAPVELGRRSLEELSRMSSSMSLLLADSCEVLRMLRL